jgi:hypothetical protein
VRQTRESLRPLTETVAALQAPCRRNKHESEICPAVDAWAATRLGLGSGARFGEMASRAFPETEAADAVLFGQWLAWLFAFDDLRDDRPVLVIAHHRGVGSTAATVFVLDRIEERIEDLQNAARALPWQFRRLAMTRKGSCDASKVAMVLLGAPRGHLEWLLESERYGSDAAIRSASSLSAMPSSR